MQLTHLKFLCTLTLMLIGLVVPLTAQEAETVIFRPAPLEQVYLPNPGIGWQHMVGEEVGSVLPETVAYPSRSAISWAMLNPAPENYAWEVLDTLLNQAVDEGKMFSFRVYTMIGETYGGHQVPGWVLDSGAVILADGSPDYSNCTYQEAWGTFVNQLRERYDGHPDIAFIDISGYGNFNEWSWTDPQTEWDYFWEDAYSKGIADAATMETIDSYSRRRLADMFIGGWYDTHECRNSTGEIETISYDYPGFQQTQLIMPYAGIRQSTQYVVTQRRDVGFRYDCLGRESSIESILQDLREEIEFIWRHAPVAFEFCPFEEEEFLIYASELMRGTHASVVHDNLADEWRIASVMASLTYRLGYRFTLDEIRYPASITNGAAFDLAMNWRNIGYAPVYPRMNLNFELRLAFTDKNDQIVAWVPLEANIPGWLPAEDGSLNAPQQELSFSITIPDLPAGTYHLQTAIVDLRSGKPIALAIEGRAANGYYTVGKVDVVSN